MTKSNLKLIEQPAENNDPLTELLRSGAQKLIAQAVEVELELLLERHADLKLDDGRKAVVRNGYLPERKIQTGLGDVTVKVPKVRDRSDCKVKFTSTLLPPYLKRAKTIEELLPWLYLRGISTGDFQEALGSLLGKSAQGLSASTISRLKSEWIAEHSTWCQRDISKKKYVYWWADGIYSKVRKDNKLCLLVIIGVDQHGRKELVTVEDGFRESEASWVEVLAGLRHHGLQTAPSLAIGDGALGFWNAMTKIFPETKHQRCWVHKTANVLNKLPKSMQEKVKQALHDIWMAETKENAENAFNSALSRFSVKYPKAMKCLEDSRDELLTFYDFPAEHWLSIRTTNPIESAFSTVRLRSKRARNCGSRSTTLAMVFKLLQVAQKNWRRLRGFRKLQLVASGKTFKDGILVAGQSTDDAA